MMQGSECRAIFRPRRAWVGPLALLAGLLASPGLRADEGRAVPGRTQAVEADVRPNQAARAEPEGESPPGGLDPRAAMRSLQTVALFGLISMAPVALLMLTGFIRISIVLTLLRQALGSPQVPGNQVITALSLLLTTLVMWPYGERIYREAVAPYAEGRVALGAAWESGSQPIKTYMIRQLHWTHHEGYLEALYEYAVPSSPGRAEPVPQRPEDYPFRVIAPAFLLSELTTGILTGFYIYLPFLVVDLVVSAVLAATGLFMLPPSLVSTPIKLILFVLADGWMLVATMLLRSFGPVGG